MDFFYTSPHGLGPSLVGWAKLTPLVVGCNHICNIFLKYLINVRYMIFFITIIKFSLDYLNKINL